VFTHRPSPWPETLVPKEIDALNPFAAKSWLRTWLWTASIGAAFLIVFFGGYEILERAYLLDLFTTDELFLFHIYRGVGAAVILGSWSFYNIWRTRQRYDQAFRRAYRELEGAMEERSRELVQAQAFTERLFDTLRDRLMVIDQNGAIVKANRVVKEACGADPAGRKCSASLAGACSFEDQDCVARRALESGEPVVGQLVRTDPKTGRIFQVDAYPVPDAEGRHHLVIEAARDITEAKQLEAQLRNQEKLAALGVLAAGIAHDIGNPLASMSSELEMLEGVEDLSRMRESVAVLREHVARIHRTLREMTDFARRRGEEATLVTVGVAVNDALRMVRHDPRARKVRITTRIEPELPPLWMVEDHLVMVLVNLFINSFDAMPQGGRLGVRADRRGERLHLEVEDGGVGMNEETRRRAIEPLFTTKGGGQGTGLGLSVCADVVRAAGGTLEIESERGVGTTVRIELPFARAERRAAHG
jgi:PAS domain S-box-containing protein